ncbi:MAG: SGNH/GDSL hydrolase family protein [Lentisphaerae bacterium]|nr:SGNH/GDSL hydrolase family protein [Lentisphaerota bacterium]
MKIPAFLIIAFFSFLLSAAPRLQNKLQLPGVIYAVPGIECNIYFENTFLTINPANFAFEVKCAKGRCDEKRWRFTPKTTETGSYDLTLRVFDDEGIVAERTAKVVVVPADSGKGRELSLLLVGSSNIAHQHAFPRHIYSLFQTPGNPALKMIGENGPADSKAVRHEGYGGWTYKLFTSAGRKRVKGRGSNHRENPFWNFKTASLDFPAYFKKNNSGKSPDFIIVSLGGNDTFIWDDTNIDKALAELRDRIRIFVSALRKAAPDAVIGLNQMEYCSKSQDAFGKNYGTLQTRWQTRKNLFKYRNMLEEFVKSSGDKKLFAIPIYIAIDNENNVVRQKESANARNKTKVLRDANGLHPLPAGYQQTADLVYAWIKYQLTQSK